ncbi:MAG TPA: ABC transporter permease [Acidobacteriaceae bacterium]|jgi:predicted permease|nr:ABC transporter permease [Acidobacteriaceae bacterium]
MQTLLSDLRYALRQMRKSPGFTLTAILTLALGIGATTGIFSLFQQVLLHNLPVPDPQQIVLLRATGAMEGSISAYGDLAYYFSVPMYRDLRQQSGKVFANMAASGPFLSPMRIGTATEDVQGNFVTGSYFATLGLRPAIGRLIESSDDTVRGGNPVVVLSYSEWQSRFGGSPSALNQTVDINAHPFTIIGVTPPGFTGIDRQQSAQIFAPMSMEPILPTHDRSWLDMHDAIWINIVGRLQPGMTRQRAEVELAPLWLALKKNELPLFGNHSQRFSQAFLRTHLFVTSGAQGLPFLQRQLGPEVEVLMAMATLVLLIACVNLANLLLVRGTIRMKEIGVRSALGASRGRLMAWVLIEGLLLALLGGAAGVGLGLLAKQPLVAGLFGQGAKAAPITSPLGLHLLFFAAIAMFLTGLLSCLPSMFLSTRPDLTQVLHENTMQHSRGGGRLRLAFTTVQIMLSFVLLVGACLLARTLYNLRNVDLGIRTDHVIKFFTDPRSTGTQPKQTPALMEKVADAIRREPGIASVGYASVGILSGDRSNSNITIAGYKPREDEDMSPDRNFVSPDFFTTLGIPLMVGRVFENSDQAGAPKVAVVNEVFAKHYFGSVRGALGQMFGFESGSHTVRDTTIVGVVRNAKSVHISDKPVSVVYIPFAQGERHQIYFYVRTALNPNLVMNEVRRAVQGVNPELPLDNLGTLKEQVSGDMATPQLLAELSISFGLLAALLAAIGLYGVLAYSMTQRTREIGIRMALGADRFQVVQLVVRQVVAMAAIAIVLGVPLSLLLSRYLRSELFQVAYNDPWSFAAAGLLLFCTVALSAWIPARRAAGVDPLQALRSE